MTRQDLRCEFVIIENLNVGDKISAGTITALRHTQKSIMITSRSDRTGEKFTERRTKGGMIAVFTPASI